ncbi:DUF3971 domain-containing protein [Terasakiella pusilla]|uniref:YhdP family protein n=1 Tax=Terasakiella pusilla TaxID=64973 RepID=UPI003AA92EEF
MVWKTVKHSLQILIAVLAGLALVLLVLAWKLSQGPISLPQLTPYIVDAVSQNTRGIQVKIKDTILSWEGWDRNLDIRLQGVNVFTRDGRRLASIPEASVSMSGRALFNGIVAPNSVELIRPTIHLMRHGDGTLAFEMGGGMTVRADKAFDLDEFVASAPDPNRPLTYLTEINVENGEFEYVDKKTGATFKAPDTSFHLERIGETIVLDTGVDLILSGRPAKMDVSASYNLTTEILDAQVMVHKLHLAGLTYLMPELSQLKGVDLTVEGKTNVAVDKAGNIRSFFAELSANDGQVAVAELGGQTLNVDTASVRLGYEDFNDIVKIEEILVALEKGSLIHLPEPFNHDLPMETIRLSGEYDTKQDSLNVDKFTFDLGEGPTGTIKVSVEGALHGTERKIDLVGELLNVEPTKLHRYWPAGLSDDARDWVVNQIYGGLVPRAGINLSLTLPQEGEPVVHYMNGDMDIQDVSVNYLPPLPPAHKANGWAEYDQHSFNINVTSGEVGEIKVKDAKINITGLDEYDQRFSLDLNVSSPLREGLAFIDKEPLGFAEALGIDPERTSGQTDTNLQLTFLLLKDIDWDGVEVTAKSVGKNIAVKDVIFEQNLSKGEITLNVDKKGMDVEGSIVLGTIPADLKWRENFSKETLFKRRFLLDGIIDDGQRENELKLDFPPFNDDIMKGPIHVDATITENWDGHGELETFTNLTGASLDVPVINWHKPKEAAGEAYAKVTFNRERVISVPYFSVSAPDLKAAGALSLNAAGNQLHTMEVTRFQAGRTDIAGGTILYSDKTGWEVDINGESLDLTALLDGAKTDKAETAAPQNADTDVVGTFSGRFNKIWLDDKHSLNTVAGALSSDGKIWTQAHLTGVVGGGQPFMIDLSPQDQNRLLKMETKDAGALLRALDLFDDMQDGNLVIEGVFNDDVADRPLVGTIKVDDYRITKVPALAKIMSLAGITGFLDTLQGDGIGFNSLTSPFKYNNGVLEFKDGRTNGISIGLTWEGKLYTYAKVANIRGTVVPAYGLNSILGNVPLLGQIFSGGEKGGGLFAWTYNVTGSLEDPDVSVNPVSGLAPGFLRKLFQLGDTDEAPPSALPKSD